jgi:hypothetical protein
MKAAYLRVIEGHDAVRPFTDVDDFDLKTA